MPVNHDLTPAGIWIRVSSGGQDEQSQVPDLEKFCAAHGYAIKKRYELHDKSAYHGEQEAKQDEALADTRAGIIRALVVWASDRLERRGAEATLKIFRQFGEAGGRVESVLEPFLNGEDPELMIAITGWKDRAESKRKSERVLIKHDALREAESLIGKPSWGLRVVKLDGGKKTLAPTSDGLKYMPEMFRRVVTDGKSAADIARWLDSGWFQASGGALGIGVMPAQIRKSPEKPANASPVICTGQGGSWWAGSVTQLLTNPVYAGHRQGGGVTILEIEPLVDATTFRRAGEALARKTGRGPVTDNRAMLTGVICCASCGGPMYRVWCGGRHRMPYYRCHGSGANRRGCGVMVRCDVADAAVHRIMSAATMEIMQAQVVADDRENALEEILFKLKELPKRELPWDEEDTERARLRAEYEQIEAKPARPDKVKPVGTGITFAQQWEALSDALRSIWLKRQGFRFCASRDEIRVEHAAWEAAGQPPVTVELEPLREKAAA